MHSKLKLRIHFALQILLTFAIIFGSNYTVSRFMAKTPELSITPAEQIAAPEPVLTSELLTAEPPQSIADETDPSTPEGTTTTQPKDSATNTPSESAESAPIPPVSIQTNPVTPTYASQKEENEFVQGHGITYWNPVVDPNYADETLAQADPYVLMQYIDPDVARPAEKASSILQANRDMSLTQWETYLQYTQTLRAQKAFTQAPLANAVSGYSAYLTAKRALEAEIPADLDLTDDAVDLIFQHGDYPLDYAIWTINFHEKPNVDAESKKQQAKGYTVFVNAMTDEVIVMTQFMATISYDSAGMGSVTKRTHAEMGENIVSLHQGTVSPA